MRAVVASVVFMVVAVVAGQLTARARPDGELVTSWEYRWDDDAAIWTPIELPRYPPGRMGGTFLELRARLPRHAHPDPVLAIDAVVAPFEARVDGVLVHEHPRGEGLAARWPPGFPWQLIALPDGGAEREIVLRVRAAGVGSVVRGTPIVTARAEALAWTVGRDIGRLTAGIAVFLLGLIGLVVFGAHAGRRVLAGYALFTSGVGLYVVHYTHLKELVVDAPRFWFGAWLTALPLLSLGLALFVDAVFGGGPRGPLRRLAQALTAYLVALAVALAAAFVLYRLGAAPASERAAVAIFTWALHGLRALIFCGCGMIVAVVTRRALGHAAAAAAGAADRREGVDVVVEARIFLAGFLLFFVMSARDIAASFGVAALSWQSQLHVGVLALVSALAVLLGRRYVRARARAAALAEHARLQAREKERLLRDLHDGVGALTSNVRLLAELGQRKLAPGEAQSTLSTIAELSGTALAELRTFVQALDDDRTMTYAALAAELRRHAAGLADAAGVTLTFDVRLDEATAQAAPPGLLTLNVVRIFREALTNALKQRGVRHIAVELATAGDAFALVVRNDGGDEERRSGAGVDAGRGLGNLRARAAELGGALAFDVGARTTLSLRVPLPLRPPAADGEPGAGPSASA